MVLYLTEVSFCPSMDQFVLSEISSFSLNCHSCFLRLSISPKARKMISFSDSPFLGTTKRWHVSIIPHSRGVTGRVNPASRCLVVIGTSVSTTFPFLLLDPLDKTRIQHDRPQRSKRGHYLVLSFPVPFVVNIWRIDDKSRGWQHFYASTGCLVISYMTYPRITKNSRNLFSLKSEIR